MIKGIVSGPGINVQGGHNSFPYVPQNSSNPIQGMIRVNGQDLQVFDGSSWIMLGGAFPSVELNGDVMSVIQWAREERDKQLERSKLIKDNPALQKALEAIQRAEANFDILAKFVENDNVQSNT
jgi:hypothetical protein